MTKQIEKIQCPEKQNVENNKMYLELIDQLSAEKKRTSMLQSSLASLRSQTPKSQTPKSNKIMEKKMKKLEQEVKQLKKGGLKDQSFKSQIRILTGQANGLKSKVDFQSNKIETLTAGLKNLLGNTNISKFSLKII